MTSIDPTQYGVCSELLASAPAIPLGPGAAHENAASSLRQLQWNEISADESMAQCCLSGLWFRYGFLEESHIISQDVHTAEGSYWHGIMHRHEPDYSNAKYWFRQVGTHPLFAPLGQAAAQAIRQFSSGSNQSPIGDSAEANPKWNPFDFVDLCEANETGGKQHDLCVALVQLEWEMLFDYCYRAANDR